MKKYLLIFILASLTFVFLGELHAEEYIVSFKKKQEEKYQNRWTLADWFETKRKMRLQDMWLASNTRQSPFEFFIAHDSGILAVKNVDVHERVNRSYFAAYANFVGLEAMYLTDKVEGDGWNALFHLRALGDSVQNTNLTFSYGLRNREADTEKFQNQFYQASLTIYFTKYFGIEGFYRKIMKAKGSNETEVEGNRTEASVFIDYSFVRPYVSWTKLDKSQTPLGFAQPIETNRTGYMAGLKLFF